jgi:hypothetical protein
MGVPGPHEGPPYVTPILRAGGWTGRTIKSKSNGRVPFGWPELNAWVRVDPSDADARIHIYTLI